LSRRSPQADEAFDSASRFRPMPSSALVASDTRAVLVADHSILRHQAWFHARCRSAYFNIADSPKPPFHDSASYFAALEARVHFMPDILPFTAPRFAKIELESRMRHTDARYLPAPCLILASRAIGIAGRQAGFRRSGRRELA